MKMHRGPKRKTYFVFCDEAGNTGTNHIDDTQPYYVVAGWMVAERNVEGARAAARDALGPLQPKQSEAKGGKLVRSVQGRARIAAMARLLGKAGGIPFMVAVHKRYSLAGRFVDYFLDPHYNPKVWPEWFADGGIRRRFAMDIAELDHGVLDEIQLVLRTGEIERAETCAARIRDALRASGNEPLAQKVAGIIGRTAAAVDELTAEGPKSKGDSPNYAAFATALQILGGEARKAGLELRIVHDETSSFGPSFAKCYETLSQLDPESAIGREMERIVPGTVPLAAVIELGFQASDDEPLVQAADGLAAISSWLLRGAAREAREPGESAVEDLALVILGIMLHEAPALGYFVGSDRDAEEILTRLQRIAAPKLTASDPM